MLQLLFGCPMSQCMSFFCILMSEDAGCSCSKNWSPVYIVAVFVLSKAPPGCLFNSIMCVFQDLCQLEDLQQYTWVYCQS